jgi:hypothetical protein
MAGLLDPKSRVIDAIITEVGRQQAAAGGLRIRYVTFSDQTSAYDGSGGVAIKSSVGLGFESNPSVWDTITVETDESGLLLPFSGDDFTLTGDGAAIVSGSIDENAQVTSMIVSSSMASFDNIRALTSLEQAVKDEGLHVTPAQHQFTINEKLPFTGEPPTSSIDDVESFFADMRLANVPNFKFLPPVQKQPSAAGGTLPLGRYADLSERDKLTARPVEALESLECCNFEFSRQTERHTLAIQMFEENSVGVRKLDVIPYGNVGFSPEGSRSMLYYVGKVFEDGFGVPTFVNIFTVVIE